MCPKGQDLLVQSNALLGRFRWRAHAAFCASCREVQAAERFVEAFAARAGRWHVPATLAGNAAQAPVARVPARQSLAARRARMLATAEALLAVAILVAVSWAILHRAQNRVPTQLADLMRKVRTIHYVAVEYFANAKPLHREQWIKFPDKLRSDVKGNNIWIINGDRELSITPYISPPQAELDYAERGIGINSDGWTEPGIRRALHARGTRILKESVEAQPRGRPLLVIEAYREEPGHRLQEWIRYKIDRRSGLLASRVSFEKRFVGRQQLKSRSILQRIEYNRDLPDSLFSLAIPKGVVLKYDLTTPAGIRKYLEDRLGELEKEPPAQRAAIAKEWKRYGADKSIEQRLQRLPPADREAFRERYKRLGILD